MKLDIKRFIKSNSSTIMIVGGIVTSLVGVGTAIYATPKAVKRVEKKKEELETDKLTPVETVKTVWDLYIPTVTSEFLCVTLLSCAITDNRKTAAALSSAYTMTERAFREYRDKVVETIGEKKEKEVRDEIARDHVTANPPRLTEPTPLNGDQLCKDGLSGRYFYSTVEKIKRAQNELNDQMIRSGIDGKASVNEFYYILGLDDIDGGDYIGWDYTSQGLLDLDFNVILTEQDIPCLVIDYTRNLPKNI